MKVRREEGGGEGQKGEWGKERKVSAFQSVFLIAWTLGDVSHPIQDRVGPEMEYKLVTVTSLYRMTVSPIALRDTELTRDVTCQEGTGS